MKKVALILVVALSVLAGCSGVPIPVVRNYHEAIGKPFLRYVENDASLSEQQKKRRRGTVNDMEAALKKAGG